LLMVGAVIVLITVVIIARMRVPSGVNASALGWMSERWLAEHRSLGWMSERWLAEHRASHSG
jgi:hypothetical protein